MYLEKAEYLKKLYPIDDCISAITTIATGNNTPVNTPVGTPCLAHIRPFSSRSMYNLENILNGPPKSIRHNRSKPKEKEKDINATTAKDLYAMDLAKANDLLYKHVEATEALFMFSTSNANADCYTSNLKIEHIYFNGVKPMIIDDAGRYDLRRLSDVHSKNELNNFAEIAYKALQNNRYINYTFMAVAKSNQKHMMEDINTIFNSLRRIYPHNLSFFQSPSVEIRSLIDTISISFYRLTDVTAIFDHKRSIGMGVEIFLTNALYKAKDMGILGKSMTYRFLFSESDENIFTIDGEKVSRPSIRSTDTTIDTVYHVISENVPNDDVLKKEKVSRRSTCAE